MFNECRCFVIRRASNTFIFTLLLLNTVWNILKLFRDTDRWPDWSLCLSMCDLLPLPACSIILSFSILAVLCKYVSENVFSGHLTKYGRACLCSNLLWSFMSNDETSLLILYMCCAVWFTNCELRVVIYELWFTNCAVWYACCAVWFIFQISFLVKFVVVCFPHDGKWALVWSKTVFLVTYIYKMCF